MILGSTRFQPFLKWINLCIQIPRGSLFSTRHKESFKKDHKQTHFVQNEAQTLGSEKRKLFVSP